MSFEFGWYNAALASLAMMSANLVYSLPLCGVPRNITPLVETEMDPIAGF